MKINIITEMILATLCLLLFAGTVADAFAGPLPSTGGHPLDSSLSNAQGEFASYAPARPHDAPDVRHPSTWWDEDVWADPDRPFLYYGDNEVPDMRPDSTVEPPEPQSVVKPDEKPFDPEDFTAFKTVEDLRAERERRLNTAIMNPSPANMQSYQAINAHLLALSARFAQAWQLGRMLNPGYDWTTTAPSANFATVELGAMKRDKSHALVKSLQGDAGLLFIGKKGDPLTQVAAGPVRAFANIWGLELLAVADGIDAPAAGTSIPGFEGFALVQPDAGRAKKLGVNTLPAVILVPNPRPCHDPTSHSCAEDLPVATACSSPQARFRARNSRAASSSSSRTLQALKTRHTSGAAPRPLALFSCHPILRSGCRPPKLPILRPS